MNQILLAFFSKKMSQLSFWLSTAVVCLSLQATSAQLTVQLDPTSPICGGFSTGSITAIPSGGLLPYSYLWNTGDSTMTISQLPTGFYEVTVTDAMGDTVIDSVTLTAPPQVGAEFTISSCTIPVIITAEAFGGIPPYKFMWSTGDTTASTEILDPGEYCLTFCDSEGCGYTTCITITGVPPSVEVEATDVLCAGDTTGSIEAIITGGTAPYDILWSTGDTTAVVTGLGAGVYSVTITDSNGCMDEASGEVSESDPVAISLNTIQPTCEGFSDGMLTAVASGGTPPYQYLWNTMSNSPSIYNLSAGTYSVTVTDVNGCTGEISIDLEEQSNITVIAEATDINCFGFNDGTATATVTDGVPPYQYLWSNNETTSMIDGLAPGIYSVTATDELGCTDADTVEVLDANPFSLELEGTDATVCAFSDGTVTALPSGGAPPYSYLWSTGDTTAMVSDLPGGTYSVTVTDDNGCELTGEITINDPPFIDVPVDGTNEICAGDENGTATANPMGTPPYIYEWNNGETTQSISGLAPGQYFVTVTDASGCMGMGTVVIEPGIDIMVSITAEDISCFGENDGSATVSATGGGEPYTIEWSTGDTTATIENLGPGAYTVMVTDTTGCTGVGEVVILEPEVLTLDIVATDVSCPGGSDGMIVVTPNGGTQPYTYEWNIPASDSIVTGLLPGTYEVTVTDVNGCVATGSAQIDEPDPITINIIEEDASCVGAMNGTLTANVMGGTSPYSFEWSNGATIAIAENLDPGDYDLTVTDANGCEAFATGTVGVSNDLEIVAEVLTQPCEGTNGGSAFATVTGGVQPYNVDWSNGDMGLIAMDLIAGTYTVSVTDDLGCVATDNITLAALETPTCEAVVTQEISIPGASDGEVTVNASGGEAPYSFLWNTGDTSQTITGLSEGIYSVTVTDLNGCTSNCSVSLGAPPSAKVGDRVWEDYDEDGIQDPGEPGLPNVSVTINGTDYLGNPFSMSILTDGNGNYLFDPIPPGDYQLTFDLLQDYFYSPQDAGSNDAVDSDVDTLTGTTAFFTLVDGDCDLSWDAGMHLFCINITDAGMICCDEFLCGPGNDPALIYETSPPVGGVGALEYLWMMSTTGGPFNQTNWTPIPNSNSPTYDPGPIQTTTHYIRCTRRAGCIEYLETNPIVKEVGDDAVADISGPATICVDETVTFTTPDNGPGAIYSWDFGPNATPSTASTQTVNVTFTQYGVYTIELTVENNDCISTDLMDVFVTNSPTLCDDPAMNLTGNWMNGYEVMLAWNFPEIQEEGVFVIEHSKDAAKFEILDVQFPVQGESNYQLIDTDPMPGYNHYQVRYVGNEGATLLFSNTVEMMLPQGNTKALLYPNPVKDQLTLDLLLDFEEEGVVEIYSLTGQKLAEQVIAPGIKQHEISTDKLPAGTYLLVIRQHTNGVETLKFVKY